MSAKNFAIPSSYSILNNKMMLRRSSCLPVTQNNKLSSFNRFYERSIYDIHAILMQAARLYVAAAKGNSNSIRWFYCALVPKPPHPQISKWSVYAIAFGDYSFSIQASSDMTYVKGYGVDRAKIMQFLNSPTSNDGRIDTVIFKIWTMCDIPFWEDVHWTTALAWMSFRSGTRLSVTIWRHWGRRNLRFWGIWGSDGASEGFWSVRVCCMAKVWPNTASHLHLLPHACAPSSLRPLLPLLFTIHMEVAQEEPGRMDGTFGLWDARGGNSFLDDGRFWEGHRPPIVLQPTEYCTT